MKRPITILNLSDLHIADEKFSPTKSLEELPSALVNWIKNKGQTKWIPDYITIAGDIIDNRTKNPNASYKKASDILDMFLGLGSLDKSRLIAAPGNHDKKNISNAELKNPLKRCCNRKRYGRIKKNFDEFNGINKTKKTTLKFVEIHESDFQSFSTFYQRYNTKSKDYEYIFYDDFNNCSLKYVSGLKVFPNHKVCFLCLNTEWLYTRDKIEKESKQEHHPCTPIVKFLTNKLLSNSDYADYTIVTLMHRKPDDLSWEVKNHTDDRKYDALSLIEQYSDIIFSGHNHPIKTSEPDFLKNRIQHFKLGVQGCITHENERFIYSASAIHVNPINMTIELLTGRYNKYDKWDFEISGTFPLRNKYAYEDHKKIDPQGQNSPIHLKTSSSRHEHIKRAIQLHFRENNGFRLNYIRINTEEKKNKVVAAFSSDEYKLKKPTHLVLYSINADNSELKLLNEAYKILNEREYIQKAKLQNLLVISKIIVVVPQNDNLIKNKNFIS